MQQTNLEQKDHGAREANQQAVHPSQEQLTSQREQRIFLELQTFPMRSLLDRQLLEFSEQRLAMPEMQVCLLMELEEGLSQELRSLLLQELLLLLVLSSAPQSEVWEPIEVPAVSMEQVRPFVLSDLKSHGVVLPVIACTAMPAPAVPLPPAAAASASFAP